jgi:hypothetical protein
VSDSYTMTTATRPGFSPAGPFGPIFVPRGGRPVSAPRPTRAPGSTRRRSASRAAPSWPTRRPG